MIELVVGRSEDGEALEPVERELTAEEIAAKRERLERPAPLARPLAATTPTSA